MNYHYSFQNKSIPFSLQFTFFSYLDFSSALLKMYRNTYYKRAFFLVPIYQLMLTVILWLNLVTKTLFFMCTYLHIFGRNRTKNYSIPIIIEVKKRYLTIFLTDGAPGPNHRIVVIIYYLGAFQLVHKFMKCLLYL